MYVQLGRGIILTRCSQICFLEEPGLLAPDYSILGAKICVAWWAVGSVGRPAALWACGLVARMITLLSLFCLASLMKFVGHGGWLLAALSGAWGREKELILKCTLQKVWTLGKEICHYTIFGKEVLDLLSDW